MTLRIDRPKIPLLLGAAMLGIFLALLLTTYGAGMHVLIRRAATFYSFAVDHAWLLVGLYVLRLPLLLPASLVIVLTGMICGPWMGELIAVIGLTLGAAIEFLLVRTSTTLISKQGAGIARFQDWRTRINSKPFHSILLLRICFVPFDAVNIVAALAQARARPFILATAIGVVPTSLPMVLSGASIDFNAWLSSGHLWPDSGVVRWPFVLGSMAMALLVAAHARYRRPTPSAQASRSGAA